MCRNYDIFISVGRVYRLIRSMQLPPKSKIKPNPFCSQKRSPSGYVDHLCQYFHQKALNLVWTSNFSYLKAGGKWYYLYINILEKSLLKYKCGSGTQIFQKIYYSGSCLAGLKFHSDKGLKYTAFAFKKLLDELNIVQSF